MPLFSKPKKKPDAEPEGGKRFESTQLAHRKDFWVCDNCGQEFRISKPAPPVCCPKCGRTRASSLGETSNSELWAEEFTCPKCKESIEMLNGARARICPCCGWEMH